MAIYTPPPLQGLEIGRETKIQNKGWGGGGSGRQAKQEITPNIYVKIFVRPSTCQSILSKDFISFLLIFNPIKNLINFVAHKRGFILNPFFHIFSLFLASAGGSNLKLSY